MNKKLILYDTAVATDVLVENEYLKHHGLQDKYEIVKFDLDTPEFKTAAAKAEGACLYTPLTEERLATMPKSKVCAIPALGADMAYIEEADRAEVYVSNACVYCTEEVATHSAALILDSVRRVSRFNSAIKEGRWNIHEGGVLHRLSGATHGLISFGRIARETARMMHDGFGVKIKAYDPLLPDSVFEEAGAERVDSIEELMASCDIVSVHTPLFPDTRHMIRKEHFDAITKPIIFVVTSRGGVVVEADLKDAILAGKVISAGIDVIEDETMFHSCLFELPEVTATPHIAYYTEEADRDLREINLADILEVLEYGRPPKNLLNKAMAEK